MSHRKDARANGRQYVTLNNKAGRRRKAMTEQKRERHEMTAEEWNKAILEEKRTIKPIPEDIVKRVKERQAGQDPESGRSCTHGRG